MKERESTTSDKNESTTDKSPHLSMVGLFGGPLMYV